MTADLQSAVGNNARYEVRGVRCEVRSRRARRSSSARVTSHLTPLISHFKVARGPGAAPGREVLETPLHKLMHPAKRSKRCEGRSEKFARRPSVQPSDTSHFILLTSYFALVAPAGLAPASARVKVGCVYNSATGQRETELTELTEHFGHGIRHISRKSFESRCVVPFRLDVPGK